MDDSTTSLAGHQLSVLFKETGLRVWWSTSESTSCFSPNSSCKSPISSTHHVSRKEDVMKGPDKEVIENHYKRPYALI